ncbi:transcriptional regulator [Bacillus paralicheniformis]|uniref:zinc ribbon domain-containing protein n=1 Tax=Bacillus paralicheniformis TaxID=1648923 RepID=UPI001AFA9E4E|nr:zinc ribbon domain-containing protein [Bacillus paralicheniformis]QSF98972.1 transcriptional regulator [Bacillus paralicheniformis]
MEHHICQSCGMPMTSELFGTEKDGGKNRDYCMYCYENGAYTHPDATLKEMIDICVPYIKEEGGRSEIAHGADAPSFKTVGRRIRQTKGGQRR